MVRSLPVMSTNGRALPRGAARGPVAVLSLHSHRERSFLDDVVLHEMSGALAAAGIDNDLVVACVTNDSDHRRLVEALRRYETLVYERVWSARVIAALVAELPGKRWVRVHGEHELSDAPADEVCAPGELVDVIAHLLDRPLAMEARSVPRPNLRPLYVADEDRPKESSYPIKGSAGCPYSADARQNPLFAGLALRPGMGRGCSFCTTGNDYEHKKPAEALASTLDQLRFVRSEAPSIERLVLRDQNPFAYLTELIEAAESEDLGPFTLMVESRADWWLQSAKRFERALAAAQRSSIRIAPFLVGIESFSQSELDRFNKGIPAETNVRFLHQLREWQAEFSPALDLGQGAFGFIMFTPWTTVDDLRINLRHIEETGLHQLRGRLLLSRARLYPDTALYYLAERDGLLVEEYASRSDDASARYGYLPAHPWRFADARVAKIAEIAAAILERRGYRDELEVFHALLDASELTVEAIEARLDGKLRLADLLVRAPRLPTALPLFGLDLADVTVDGDHVLLWFTRGGNAIGRVRVQGAGLAVAEAITEPSLAPTITRIAERVGRSISIERWLSALPFIAALRHS